MIRRVRRFVVTGQSMAPGLEDGDGLIAVRTSRAAVGERRVFEHPHRPGTWLVKRVGALRPDGRMWLVSDAADRTRADSRTFGSLPVAGSYRVVLRLPRRLVQGRDGQRRTTGGAGDDH